MLELSVSRKLRDYELALDLRVRGGEIHILAGKNGAGKSTLLHMISGLITPDNGYIHLNGKPLFDAKKGINVPVEERRIGYVLQNSAVFPHMSVRANLAYGLHARRVPRTIAEEKVQQLIERLYLGAVENVRASQLSGGQQQLVALGRALAIDPLLLLLDEPFRALDVTAITRVNAYVHEVVDSLQIPCIMVTHNPNDIQPIIGPVSVMDFGRMTEQIENTYSGRMVHNENGEAVIDIGGVTVHAISHIAPGKDVFVIIRAQDVTIALDSHTITSARNTFRGVIRRLVPFGPFVYVIINVGIELGGLITLRSAENLGLVEGKEVWGSVKATAVQVIEKH
jgi:molybdate transport system ATP-binding protein